MEIANVRWKAAPLRSKFSPSDSQCFAVGEQEPNGADVTVVCTPSDERPSMPISEVAA